MSLSVTFTHFFLATVNRYTTAYSKPVLLLCQESQYTEPVVCQLCVHHLSAHSFFAKKLEGVEAGGESTFFPEDFVFKGRGNWN